MTALAGPFAALEFLTIFRLRSRTAPTRAGDIEAGLLWFPAVGLVIGVLTAAADRGLREVLPLPAESAVIVALLVGVSGGLHLDGLADSFDGLLGGHDREARLRIMHDVATGSFGATAIVTVIVVDTFALASIGAGPARTGALVLVPLLARATFAPAIAWGSYARAEGLGRRLRPHARLPGLVSILVALGASVMLFGVSGLVVAAVGSTGAFAVAIWGWLAVGGLTGDLYGAIAEITQAATLLALASGAELGWLEPSRLVVP